MGGLGLIWEALGWHLDSFRRHWEARGGGLGLIWDALGDIWAHSGGPGVRGAHLGGVGGVLGLIWEALGGGLGTHLGGLDSQDLTRLWA